MTKCLPFFLLMFLVPLLTQAQDNAKLSAPSICGRCLNSIQPPAVKLNKRIQRQTDKYLAKLARQEQKLQKQLAQKDSAATRVIFGSSPAEYRKFRANFQQSTRLDTVVESYSSRLDSLQTALQFLKQMPETNQQKKIEAVLTHYQNLQGKLNQSERMKEYVQQRQQLLQTHFQSLGLSQKLKKYQKLAYYYQAQVSEYKQQLARPTQLEKKLLRQVRKLPAFQQFFREHSQLTALFQTPANFSLTDLSKPIPGLQTVSSVQQVFTQKFGADTKAIEAIQQKLQEGTAELTQLKDKIAAAGTPADIPLPDFKPNHQKTKTFRQRLEVGANLQSTKSNTYFPVTTDVGLSLGYKLHDKAVLGLGSSFKVGWGQDIRHLQLTRQGVGLRSFLDFQLKRSFWLTGGAELHYRSAENPELRALPHYQPWQQQALLGLTKKYKINDRYQGKVQLLYDFLHQQQAPRTQAILFRVGYTF